MKTNKNNDNDLSLVKGKHTNTAIFGRFPREMIPTFDIKGFLFVRIAFKIHLCDRMMRMTILEVLLLWLPDGIFNVLHSIHVASAAARSAFWLL